jgi:hypothetical protein
VHKKRYDRTDQEHDEQHFGDAGGARSDSTEAENCRNQCDHEKYNGVMKHFENPRSFYVTIAHFGKA